MFRKAVALLLLLLAGAPLARASIYGHVQGVVHDSQHRPIAHVRISLRELHSQAQAITYTNAAGAFSFPAVSLGEYELSATRVDFAPITQPLTLASDTTPVLHLRLFVAGPTTTVTTHGTAISTDVDSVTPITLISRAMIETTPGADRTNSMAMITDYVPGAYMTHDMLHMRGGHQLNWLIDGVEIPNTNIASNLGAQIDPKDIDYLEVQRGSYTADVGDRTYGVFNVVPKDGFLSNREGELVTSVGSFLQSNDQLSFGSHTHTIGWYASANGDRSDYGLAPPTGQVLHDAANGYGGFTSLIDNRTPNDQLRLVGQLRHDFFQIPYDPNPDSVENQQYSSSGLRDTQHETDGFAAFTWEHTFSASSLLQISPFYHGNSADYVPNSSDYPVATVSNRSSQYAGLQASATAELAQNTLEAGLYGFGQHDAYVFGSTFNDGSYPSFLIPDGAAGGVIEEFFSDNYQATPWLTLIAGLRHTWFEGSFTEAATDPRTGIALRIPRLHWVFRAFYGRYYQPPPLLTASGPVVAYANSQDTAFEPLHGERDEEHQFGVQIPWRGWLLDADNFETRANNFLDHSNIGESSLYYPVTVDGALIQAWELTLRSPELWRGGRVHLAYSNQLAEQRGAITGGLVCYPISSPQCDVAPGYTPLDHDQRNTLNLGYAGGLPWGLAASTNVYYGSGFSNGDPDAEYPGNYLPQHTTFDLAVNRDLREDLRLSVDAINVTNRRVLLDNSLTFGGFHYNDPRQIYAELRWHFHY